MLSVVGAQDGVDDRGAIGLEVVVDLRTAKRVLTITRLHSAFEVEAFDSRGIERLSAFAQGSECAGQEKDHAAFGRELQRAFLDGLDGAVLDLHHALNGDAI